MALSTAQLLEVRRSIGADTPPTDDDLNALYAELGTVELVAYQVLAERLAAMRAKPAEVVYDGDVTERWGTNLKHLEAEVERLANVAGGPSSISTGQLIRKGRRR